MVLTAKCLLKSDKKLLIKAKFIRWIKKVKAAWNVTLLFSQIHAFDF